MGSKSSELSNVWLERLGALHCMSSKGSELSIIGVRKAQSLALYGLERFGAWHYMGSELSIKWLETLEA